MTDEQWARIERFTERTVPRVPARVYDMRDVINAILYLTKTGCQWRMLPPHIPPWESVYGHFRSMGRKGCLGGDLPCSQRGEPE